MIDNTGVHASHCCKVHGCKYGDPECPVVSGAVTALYTCEDCESDLDNFLSALVEVSEGDLKKVFSQVGLGTQRKVFTALLDSNPITDNSPCSTQS